MSEQIGFPFQPGSDTSRDAALLQKAQPKKVERDRARILGAIKAAGRRGLTDAECQAQLVMGGSTQRPRRGELARIGVIQKNGLRRNGSAVWVAA